MEVIFEIIRTLVAPAAQIVLALLGAYLLTLWVVLVIWTFRDIEARSRSVVTQVFATLLPVFFFLPGLMLYMILRPRETLDEAFQRALQEEYLLQDLEELPLCPTCRHYVQADYVLCPHCHSRLRENCPSCARLVELRWDVCPYCSASLPDHGEHEDEVTVESLPPVRLPKWVNPAMGQLRARVAGLREQAVARLGEGGSPEAGANGHRPSANSRTPRRLSPGTDRPLPDQPHPPAEATPAAEAQDAPAPPDPVGTRRD